MFCAITVSYKCPRYSIVFLSNEAHFNCFLIISLFFVVTNIYNNKNAVYFDDAFRFWFTHTHHTTQPFNIIVIAQTTTTTKIRISNWMLVVVCWQIDHSPYYNRRFLKWNVETCWQRPGSHYPLIDFCVKYRTNIKYRDYRINIKRIAQCKHSFNISDW